MRSVLFGLSLLVASSAFAENKATKADREGGKTPSCPATVQETRGKNDNVPTGRRVKAGPCGKPSTKETGNGGRKR